MEKLEKISREIDELNKLFVSIPSNKAKMIEGLIQNAAFMRVTLEELQKDIMENGSIIECQSGNGFDIIKDNPAQKAYTTMIARYTQTMSQLLNLLPESTSNNDEKRNKLLGLIHD